MWGAGQALASAACRDCLQWLLRTAVGIDHRAAVFQSKPSTSRQKRDATMPWVKLVFIHRLLCPHRCMHACMPACPSTLAIADDLPRLWTLASPVDVPTARLAFDLHADQVFLGVGSRLQVTSLTSLLCDVCRLAVGASEKQQGRSLRVLVVLGHSHRDRATWNRRSPACTNI